MFGRRVLMFCVSSFFVTFCRVCDDLAKHAFQIDDDRSRHASTTIEASFYLSIYLSICLSVCLSVCLRLEDVAKQDNIAVHVTCNVTLKDIVSTWV